MARYSNEFKARALARLLPPESAPIPRISQNSGGAPGSGDHDGGDGRGTAQRSARCGEQGLFPADLQQWRQSAMSALSQPEEARASPQETREDRRRIKELERDLRRKEKALAETAALLVLSKQFEALFRDGGEE
jgi:transposase